VAMDRVFLDANILFSAAYGLSALDKLWELSRKGQCILIASGYAVEEARRNLSTEKQRDRLESYISRMEIISEADPSVECDVELPDKDKPILMAAVSSKAGYLLTGDARHFGRFFGETILGVKILRVRDYIASLTRSP